MKWARSSRLGLCLALSSSFSGLSIAAELITLTPVPDHYEGARQFQESGIGPPEVTVCESQVERCHSKCGDDIYVASVVAAARKRFAKGGSGVGVWLVGTSNGLT